MELRNAATISNNAAGTTVDISSENRINEDRLNLLLAINRDIERDKSLYRSDRERREAAMMSKPVSMEKAVAYFGLMLGSLPPAAIFARFLMAKGMPQADEIWILGLILLANLTSAIVGYFTGKKVAGLIRYLDSISLSRSLILLPFIGIVWGMASGAAGGFFLFLIGALFGAVVGGTVGAFALPTFVVLHKMMKRGEFIDTRHFLPISLGVTLTICAFFLGL